MTSLKEYLSQSVAFFEPPFATLERFVLRNGRGFTSGKLPRGIKLGPIKNCYMNAAHLAMEGVGKYVEGFAARPDLALPLSHAWVITPDNVVIDNTWRKSAGTQYMGYVFETDTLERQLLKNGVYGVLDTGRSINVELMLELDPELPLGPRAADFIKRRESK